MKEQFLAQEAIKAGKKSRQLLIGAFLFFTCMVSILAFALKDSFQGKSVWTYSCIFMIQAGWRI